MNLRSLLFVPGDRPERMEKALHLGARALILDLEDAVAPARKAAARAATARCLAEADRRCTIFVRINPLGGELAGADLAAVVPAGPDGIVLPKAEGGASIAALDRLLTELETAHGLRPGNIAILPIATETPAAVFALGSYGGVTPRLAGLTWGAEDLPAAIGATSAREPDGRFTPPYEMCRALALFGAAAAGVPAIETVYPDFYDLEGLAAFAGRARRDGFAGMMAIHPAQVPVIERAFAPTAAEVSQAEAIVAAFAADPGAGTLALGGRMIDRPHLEQARRLLARR